MINLLTNNKEESRKKGKIIFTSDTERTKKKLRALILENTGPAGLSKIPGKFHQILHSGSN